MKKLAIYFFAGILLVSASCNSDGSKSGTDSSAANQLKAPEGTNSADSVNLASEEDLSYDQVKTMVDSFKVRPQYFTERTTCWFSREYIDDLSDALHDAKNNLDGVRIYLGLNKGKKLTFLIVPTQKGIPNQPIGCDSLPEGPKSFVHNDAFGISIPGHKYPVRHGRDESENDPSAQLSISGCDAKLLERPVFTGLKDHTILCSEAKNMVRSVSRQRTNGEEILTSSEWFETAFIDKMKKILHGSDTGSKKRDGLRIYLARNNKPDCKNKFRHIYILITTFKESHGKSELHVDNLQVLADPTADDNGEQCLNNCKGATLN